LTSYQYKEFQVAGSKLKVNPFPHGLEYRKRNPSFFSILLILGILIKDRFAQGMEAVTEITKKYELIRMARIPRIFRSLRSGVKAQNY
jgi:hypothetical protein